MKDWFSDPLGPYLRQLLEQQRAFDRLIEQADPLRRYRSVLDQMDGARTMGDALQARGTRIEAAFRSLLLDDVLGQAAITSPVAALAKRIDIELASLSGAGSALEALTRSTSRDYMSTILRQHEQFEKLTANLGRYEESFRHSQLQAQAALASAEATARLYTLPELHWSNTLGLISSYETFALSQARKTKTDSKTVATRRSRVTELAGTLLTAALGASETAAAATAGGERQQVSEVTPRLWSPLNQHLGYVYRAELSVEVDSSFAASLPVQICHVGAGIVDLLIRINEVSRLAGGSDIFSPTNRFVTAAATIPIVVVGSDRSFGEVVNALYFLLYEASGEGTRILALSSEEELNPLWRIKHLRLRYDHDIEHGNPAEVRRKYAKIAAAFQSLIQRNLPSRPAEWAQCQAQLYAQVYEMLAAIEGRLSAGRTG